jgi:uncharacterized membrane protein
MRFFGESVLSQRTLSLVFGAFSIPALFCLGNLLLNRRVALISSLIFAFSPLMIYFSSETRMYSQLTFLTLLTVLFFFKWLKNQNISYSFGFLFTFLAALYTHYYSFLLLLPLNLIFVIAKYRRLYLKFLYLEIIAMVLVSPWILVFFLNPHPKVFAQSILISLPSTFASFILGGTGIVTLRQFFEFDQRVVILVIFILSLIFFGLIFCYGLLRSKKEASFQEVILFLISPLALLTVTGLIWAMFSVRSTVFLAPYFYLLFAATLTNLKPKTFRFTIFITISLLIAVNTVQFIDSDFKGPPLKKLAFEVINTNTIAHTSVLTYYPFRYYAEQIRKDSTYYYAESDKNHLIAQNPLTAKTQKIIGGQVIEWQKLPERFYLIEIKNGNDPIILDAIRKELSTNYKVQKVKNYGDVTSTFLSK